MAEREVASGDTLDLDLDGEGDFVFHATGIFCTQNIPTSGCIGGFELQPLTGRSVLRRMRGALGSGDQIGLRPDGGPSTEEWWDSYGAGLLEVRYDMIAGTHEVSHSPFFEPGEAYIGVRLGQGTAARYGWIRLSASVEVWSPANASFNAVVHGFALGGVGDPVVAGEQP